MLYIMEFEEYTTDTKLDDITPHDTTQTNNIIEPIYNITNTILQSTTWVTLYNLKFLVVHYKNPYLYISLTVSDDNLDVSYTPDQSKIQSAIDYLDKFYNQNEELMFGKIYNISNIGSIELKHMHMFAMFLKSIATKTDKQVYASAIIIKNNILISILNTFLVLYNNSRPIKIVNNIKDAKLFIKNEMIYYQTHGKLNSI